MQTPLNFLFSWLIHLIFESEIGGYLGTISAIFIVIGGQPLKRTGQILSVTEKDFLFKDHHKKN